MLQQSPFENIFNMIGGLSQGNEKPMKHGFYNAFALLVLAICCAAVYVLFLILEPFFKPLYWALLVGSLLHPFKYRLSKQLKAWFDGLEKSNTSVVFGIAIIPFNVVNYASNTIGSQFKEHYKLVMGVLAAVFVLPWLYCAVPRALLCLFWQLTNFLSVSMQLLINIFNSYVMVTVALAYLICLLTMWTRERAPLFRKSSLLMWLCVSSYLAGLAGAFQVYLFILLQLAAVAGFVVEVLDVHKQLSERDHESSIFTSISTALSNTRPYNESVTDYSPNANEKAESCPETPITTGVPIQEQSLTDSPITNERSDIVSRRKIYSRTLSALPLNQTFQYDRSLRKSLNDNDFRNTFRTEDEDETALYFKLLFFGCTCVLIWKQMWLLPMTLFFLGIYFVRMIGDFFGVWAFVQQHYDNVINALNNWWKERSGALVPAHVRGALKMMSVCNRSIRSAAYGSVDTVSSCIVITGLILFLISASIFLCIQIYSEAVVVVQLGSSVLNSSAVRDSQLWGYLPEGWEDSVDSLFDNAYTYGREGLSKVVKSVLKEGETEKVARVEQQVLELWDRVYQSWMSGGFQSVGPQVDGRAVQDSWDNLFTDITSTPGMVEWLQANVGTLTAIAGSVWAPLASNFSLLAGSLAAFTSVLLCGGTAILNFIFSLVVFFTTLFYLLASSGALYKPVEVITQTQPSFGPRLGSALSVAINQVFRASFKMALFYGLWTWLVHNLFGAKVVYLPSVLAAVLGAAPFLGTWLACVPAALDVWLAQGRPLAAVLLPLAQFAPISFVDAAIYKEIRNGGHPYLTGLAIAGGIFYLGPEGAILGPLLLCCLLVVFNLSSSFLRETPSDERAASAAAAALHNRIR